MSNTESFHFRARKSTSRDFESQAMQSGSEDPEVANVLQKCEEYVPGKVQVFYNADDAESF